MIILYTFCHSACQFTVRHIDSVCSNDLVIYMGKQQQLATTGKKSSEKSIFIAHKSKLLTTACVNVVCILSIIPKSLWVVIVFVWLSTHSVIFWANKLVICSRLKKCCDSFERFAFGVQLVTCQTENINTLNQTCWLFSLCYPNIEFFLVRWLFIAF